MTRWLAVAFAGGVWLLQQQARLWTEPDVPAWPGAGFTTLAAWGCAGAACALAIAAAWRGRARVRGTALVALALMLGFGWAHLRAQSRLADALPIAWEGRDVVVTGVVRGLPFEVAGISAGGTRFVFEVERVETPGAIVPRRMSLTWYASSADGAVPVLTPGERWRWVLRLRRPHGGANPYGFDVERWLLEQDLRATGTVRAQAQPPQRLDASVMSPMIGIDRARDAIARHIRTALAGAPYAGVIVALVVGEQRGIASDDWVLFNRTGIGHLLSISGLHITMLAALGSAGMAWAWRRAAARGRRWAQRWTRAQAAAAAGLFTAAGYTLLAGFAVPAQRTLWMLAVVALALFAQRRFRPSYVLAAALAIVVALDPWAVDAPGFWLSFGAVAALMYAALGATEHAREAGPRRRAWWAALRSATRAQIAVTVALVPLTMLFFQQVSLISPLANAIAIPVVSLVVTPLALLGGLTSVVMGLDWPLRLAHTVFAWLARPLQAMGAWPIASLEWPVPTTAAVALALLGLAWLAAPRGVPGRIGGMALLLPLLLTEHALPAERTFRATVFDVGQGMAVLIETARHRILYDAGPRYTEDADAANRVVLPHLRAVGATELDAVVLSHRDLDHAGGLQSLLAERAVAQVVSPLDPGDALLTGARSTGRCSAGLRWDWDGVRFEVLHPQADALPAREHSNAGSCVLRVAAGERALMLAGDIEAAQEADLIARYGGGLRADALLVPHHGSASSSSAGFIAAVQPRLAVLQVGYRNRFGHPRVEVLERYAKQGAQIARTDRDGAIMLEVAPTGLAWTAWRAERPRYWQDPR